MELKTKLRIENLFNLWFQSSIILGSIIAFISIAIFTFKGGLN